MIIETQLYAEWLIARQAFHWRSFSFFVFLTNLIEWKLVMVNV